MKPLLILLVITSQFIVTALAACDEVLEENITHYQQKWQNNHWNDYRFVVQRKCFCYVDYTREMIVQVNDGKVVSAQYTDTKEFVDKEVLTDIFTISEWFDVIHEAHARQADRLKVYFNEKVGNPSKIIIDLRANRTDDEQAVVISHIEQL
jgi:hypothetical protein